MPRSARLRPERGPRRRVLDTLLLAAVLLLVDVPQACQAAVQAPSPRDHVVEDAILQTQPPSTVGEADRQLPQQQQQQQERQHVKQTPDERRQQRQQQQRRQEQRRRQQAAAEEEAVRLRQQAQDARLKQREAERLAAAQRERAEHEAAHAAQLESQRRQAAEQRGRLAAAQESERQQASLGRGSLRSRRQAVQRPAVSGSRPGDAFAEATERRLAEARARLAARREEQAQLLAKLEAAQAAAQAAARARAGGGGAATAVPKPRQQAGAAGALGGGSAAAAAPQRPRIPLLVIVAMTLAMAGAAGLGALPFFFVRSMSDAATGLATAVACGVMLAASFDLVHDGQPYGAALTVGGVLLGGAFIRWVQQQLAAYEDIQFGELQGSSARKTVLMVGIMAAHALGEGCAVGVSFCGERGWSQGLLTTLAIGVHNIPEGLAKATVLVGQGVGPRRALAWSVATCLPQPLVAIPSFVFVDAFAVILPVALGFAAGCMVWMVFAELLPDALEHTPAAQVATAATMSAAGLEAFRMLFAAMEAAEGGSGGAVGSTAGVVARMAAPLLVLAPGVAAAAAAGGALGGSAAPPPVAWGVAAAAAAAAGGGSLLDQLAYRPQVPALHTAAAAAVGIALILLLHRQLLSWSGAWVAGPARRLAAKGGGGAGGGTVGPPPSDLEALEYSSLYQQHHLHHSVHATHPLFRHNGEAAPPPPDGGPALPTPPPGSLNGFGGSSTSLAHQAPYHRGGSGLPGADSHPRLGPTGAATPPRGGRHAAGLPPAPPPQLAAAAAACAALAGAAVSAGWHLACALLLLGEYRSAAILPAAAALLAGPGLAGGALARALPGRSQAALGAWLGGGLAALAAASAALAVGRARESAHTAAVVRAWLYPLGITDTAEAMAGGALCAAAVFLFGTGAAVKPASARGGLVLGLLAAGLLALLRYALCAFTPYCLSVQLLLKGR